MPRDQIKFWKLTVKNSICMAYSKLIYVFCIITEQNAKQSNFDI